MKLSQTIKEENLISKH